MRAITSIIVHCADTYPDMDIGAEEIRKWHVEGNRWSDIGYHYIIRRDGIIETGRDLDNDGNIDEEIGAHAYGFNANSLGICMVGGKGRKDGGPEANFTMAQYATLVGLINKLRATHNNPEVKGHRDVSHKACPSFNVQALMETE
ncbi:MAG: N-acetylmuramoyl-L-alanine amidase [Rhodospirillaceae bacterium]|nr:N-acetylmuramoyl-L-alanine amidase [Rhodospirillaceae bacterium]